MLDIEVIDPIDTEVVDVTLTAREAYIVLNALYTCNSDAPEDVYDVVKYIEDRLLDNNLPLTPEDFDHEYLHTHPDDEAYKRISIWEMEETP